MNTRTKLIALLLAAATLLSLAACSFNIDAEPETTPEVSNSPAAPEASDNTSGSVLPENFVADPNVEDLCLAAADIPGDFELLTVNGQPVSARMYLYWLAFSISETESNMYSRYGTGLDWSEELSLVEYLKADALNATLMYTLIPSKVKELGYDLTADQVAEFDDYTNQTIAAIGGDEAFNESLRMLGLDRDTYLDIERTRYYYHRLLEKLSADHPTSEGLTAYAEEKGGVLGAKHILLLTKDMTTGAALADDVIAQKKATAENVLNQLQESDDLAADFDALMHEHSEDGGLVTNPDGYTFVSGEMVKEFEEGTRALEIGQISGIIESTYGYHIILRQEPDLTDPSLPEKCLNWLATEQVNTWISEAELVYTDEYMNLDPRMFYEKFLAYQYAFYAEQDEES